jgi:hypothetical protein
VDLLGEGRLAKLRGELVKIDIDTYDRHAEKPCEELTLARIDRQSGQFEVLDLAAQASARARRKALSRTLRVSLAAALNSERASASRPARNRKSPLAAGNGA